MSSNGIAILGSTGSIGCNTGSVVETLADRFQIVALAARSNVAKLCAQIERHKPELVAVETEACAEELRAELRRRQLSVPRIAVGESGLVEVATHERAGCVVSATVGAGGVVPTLRALQSGKRGALATK